MFVARPCSECKKTFYVGRNSIKCAKNHFLLTGMEDFRIVSDSRLTLGLGRRPLERVRCRTLARRHRDSMNKSLEPRFQRYIYIYIYFIVLPPPDPTGEEVEIGLGAQNAKGFVQPPPF